MSKYGLDAAMWHIYTSQDNARRFREDVDAYLAKFPLSEEEREALASEDRAALLELGAHPFLIYKMALRLAGGFSMEFITSYLAPLQGKTLRDIIT